MTSLPNVSTMALPRMPPETALNELPDIAIKLLAGAEVYEGYLFNPMAVMVKFAGEQTLVHRNDFGLAKAAADHVYETFIKGQNLASVMTTLPTMLNCRKRTTSWLSQQMDERFKGKVRVVFLRADQTGCGFWRCLMPSRAMQQDKSSPLAVELCDAQMTYDHLVQYDVVVVQRVYAFEHFYMIQELQKAGVKVVYEIDDDLFSVERHNPCYKVYGRYDTQLGARHCIEQADMVVVSTKELAEAIGAGEKTYIYPNSLPLSDYVVKGGSPDGKTIMFWMGSNTHDEDWKVCCGPVARLLSLHEQLELMVIGSLPPCLRKSLADEDVNPSKVNVIPFMNAEAYYEFLKTRLVADIGLIPLQDNRFNRGKSACKALEYAAVGIPIVASNVIPYAPVLEDGKTAMLCASEEEWEQKITQLITSKETVRQLRLNARQMANKNFDLRVNYKPYQQRLFELGEARLQRREDLIERKG